MDIKVLYFYFPYPTTVMEVLFSIKIFDFEFSPDFEVLHIQKCRFWKLMCAYVCVQVCARAYATER